MIENLTELMSERAGDNSERSDAAFIEEQLNNIGYWAKPFEVEAFDFSSKTWRLRMLIAGVLEITRSKTREQYMKSVLSHIRLPSHGMSDFLIDGIGAARPAKRHRALVELVYQEVHAAAFLAEGLAWPPTFSQFSTIKGLCDCDLTTRPSEVAYFIATVFKYDRTFADEEGYQYADINISLERLIGDNFTGDATSRHLRPRRLG
jgi:hypothetical protein